MLGTAALALVIGVPAAEAAAPTGRAYELVTPADKATRRGGEAAGDGYNAVIGMPSADGDGLLFSLPFGVLGRPGGSFAYDTVRSRRDATGWQAQSIIAEPVFGNPENSQLNVIGVDGSQDLSVWYSGNPVSIFPEQASFPQQLVLRFMDGAPAWATPAGWTPRAGWAPLATAASQFSASDAKQAWLVSDSGRYLTGASLLRGLLGPSDPSGTQLAGVTGGRTIYRMDLATGRRELVNECTGSGAQATLVPRRVGTGSAATDTIGTRACGTGSLTSTRGATLGAGNSVPAISVPLAGTAVHSVSNSPAHQADRVFFGSPDPTGSGGVTACGTGSEDTGGSTNCPPQLFARTWDSTGAAHVAWVSRSRSHLAGDHTYDGSQIAGQVISLMGRGVVYEGASADGSRVFFRTNAPLTPDDPNGTGSAPPTGGVVADPTATTKQNSWDLYEYDLPADPDADPGDGTLRRISGGPDGTADPNTNCAALSGANCNPTTGGEYGALRYLSSDGTKAYFVTAAPIAGVATNTAPTDGTTTTAGGATASTTTRNLYLYDSSKSGAARWEFIAKLQFSTSTLDGCASAHPLTGGQFSQTSFDDGSHWNLGATSCVRGSASGDVVAFGTLAQLTADDTDSAFDVYVYDARSDTLARASRPRPDAGDSSYTCITQGSVQCNGDVGIAPAVGVGSDLNVGPDGFTHYNVSPDGTVYFESRRSLVAGDVNGSRMDVYAYKDGRASLVSTGDSDDDAYFSGVAGDGRDVFFATTQPLDPSREIDDSDWDIYDARVGGGLPPVERPDPPCGALADRCQAPQPPHVDVATPTGAQSAGDEPVAVRATVQIKRPTSAQLRQLAAGKRISVNVIASVPGTVTLRGTTKIGTGTKSVASGSGKATRAQTVPVAVKLSTAGLKRVKAKHTLQLKLTASLAGSARAAATVTLRRPAARSKSKSHRVRRVAAHAHRSSR